MSDKNTVKEEIEALADQYGLGKVGSPVTSGPKYGCFFWWRIVFNDETKAALRESCKAYEGIHLMPYFVGEALFREVRAARHFSTKDALPNLDLQSGNLHPLWTEADACKWEASPAILQAVLVKSNRDQRRTAHWGPLREPVAILEDSEIDVIADPACYYPQPDQMPVERLSPEKALTGLLLQVLEPESELYQTIKETASAE